MTMRRVLGALIVLLMLGGCSSNTRTVRVACPPRVDLKSFPLVGLVTFGTNSSDGLDRLSTQRFLQAVQAAQPGTRVVELGSEQQVLASVNRTTWDAQTLAAVKAAHRVDVVVVGRFDVERQRPNFAVSSWMKSISAAANVDVKADLNCRLLETASGATVWAEGSCMTATIAHANVGARSGTISASDPAAVYGKMVDELVWQVTDAFRVHYVTKRVPVDQVVASAD